MKSIILLFSLGMIAQAQSFSIVTGFSETSALPVSLIQGADGNFYGTTEENVFLSNQSVVFQLTPAGALTTIYTFTGPDGVQANTLLEASDGNFYGTTEYGGPSEYCQNIINTGCGTVFKLTPSGQLTTLYSFHGTSDGANSQTPLVQGSDGNFYGTTSAAGPGGAGTLFKITPNGTLTTLYSFNQTDGNGPVALILAKDGNFYGVTVGGGAGECKASVSLLSGCGTIFRLTPQGSVVIVHSFNGTTEGGDPDSLIQGSDGNLYGTTHVVQGSNGGKTTWGTVFQATLNGTVTTLHAFDITDGADANTVIQGSDGNFYGDTTMGGSGTCFSLTGGCGTIFKLTPQGEFTTLYEFQNKNDTQDPTVLIQASTGNLYGTAVGVVGNTYGVAFEVSLTPPDAPVATSVLNGASFQPGISAGSWMTINGTNLSSKTDTWNNSILSGALPTALDGVSVMIGGQPAYIEYISPTQINAIAPNVPAGSVPVTVTTAIGTSQSTTAQLSAEQPAFFQWGTYAVATRQDFSLAVKNGTFPGTTTTPAKPGDVIILWGTGFGPTSPSAPAGLETPATTTYNTATAVSVTVGAKTTTVYGAALAPRYAGLYQIAIQIPSGLANGDYPVVATIDGMSSPSTTMITVQQ